jgi:hypothetical protein
LAAVPSPVRSNPEMVCPFQTGAKSTLLYRILPWPSPTLASMYSMILARTDAGSRGDLSMRVTTVADSPDFLWFPCRMFHIVLRGRPTTSACLSSVSNPAETSASQICLILHKCCGCVAPSSDLIHRIQAQSPAKGPQLLLAVGVEPADRPCWLPILKTDDSPRRHRGSDRHKEYTVWSCCKA